MQTLATTQQDTKVVLPKMSAQAMQRLVGLVLAEHPAEAKRIKNGVATLFGSAIHETPEIGVYLVESCTEAGAYHKATSGQCSCPDHQKRGVRCRHQWALTFLFAMSAEARHAMCQAMYERNRARTEVA